MDHVLIDCVAYRDQRCKMFKGIQAMCSRRNLQVEFSRLKGEELANVLLGKQWKCKAVEDYIDFAVKRFLKRAWRSRKLVTRSVEEWFDREDGIGEKDSK